MSHVAAAFTVIKNGELLLLLLLDIGGPVRTIQLRLFHLKMSNAAIFTSAEEGGYVFATALLCSR